MEELFNGQLSFADIDAEKFLQVRRAHADRRVNAMDRLTDDVINELIQLCLPHYHIKAGETVQQGRPYTRLETMVRVHLLQGSSSKALFNFAPRELLSITQAKFLCKRLFRVLLKSFLRSLSICLIQRWSHIWRATWWLAASAACPAHVCSSQTRRYCASGISLTNMGWLKNSSSAR